MPKPRTNSKPRLRDALLDLLWQQWAALGIAGATKYEAEWCVDPEALVLITTTQGRTDPRLQVEAACGDLRACPDYGRTSFLFKGRNAPAVLRRV